MLIALTKSSQMKVDQDQAVLRPIAAATASRRGNLHCVAALTLTALPLDNGLEIEAQGDAFAAMETVAAMPEPESAAAQQEARLAERFCAGDRQAFADLVTMWQKPVYYAIWRYVRHEEDARDLTQATFAKAWLHAATFRGESSLKTWLFRIGIHLALNHLRDQGRWKQAGVEVDEIAHDPALLEQLDEADTAQQLRLAVEELPPKQRLVVELRVQEELSFRDVAQLAQCSEDAAKANFQHAIKRLRSLLGNRGGRLEQGP